MNIIDCYWELDNFGEKVAEVVVDNHDVFDRTVFHSINVNYQYVVVKVPMNMLSFNFGLTEMGYTMIETQINISKRYKDFNFEDRLVKNVYPHVSTTQISTMEELEDIISKITPDMFSTDRIYLDPYFSHEVSSKRYINWMRKDFDNGKAIIVKTFYDEINVGFSFSHIDDDGTKHGLLGGIYEKYQDMGLGIMTTCLAFIMAKKNNCGFKIIRTAVSSNNPHVWQFYNYLGFKIDKMSYVFVKHNTLL